MPHSNKAATTCRTQQTPKPLAQLPPAVPPISVHSLLVKGKLMSLLSRSPPRVSPGEAGSVVPRAGQTLRVVKLYPGYQIKELCQFGGRTERKDIWFSGGWYTVVSGDCGPALERGGAGERSQAEEKEAAHHPGLLQVSEASRRDR